MAAARARFIRFPKATDPLNIWAISDANRASFAIHF